MTADPLSRPACRDCRFFAPIADPAADPTDVARGECRRFAPRDFQLGLEGTVNSLWPCVREIDWCGDWRPQVEIAMSVRHILPSKGYDET